MCCVVCDDWALQVKLASARYLDNLPTTGDENGRAFRDLEAEARVLQVQGYAFAPKAYESCAGPLCSFGVDTRHCTGPLVLVLFHNGA
jgi:hypothetical protein